MSRSRIADVVVIGLGAAGANAAIAAHDAGSEVLVIEKMRTGGGNSAVSAGTMVLPRTVDQGVEYYRGLAAGTIDDDVVRSVAEAMVGVPDLLRQLGVEFTTKPHRPPSFPTLADGHLMQLQVNPTGISGFQALEARIAERDVQVFTETAAESLIQKPGSREVLGVRVWRNGRHLDVLARQAVVMSCGGYAYNPAMLANFNVAGAAEYIFPWGSPGNTGDGIRIASQAGAAMWHMAALEWGKLCARVPSAHYETAIGYGVGRTNRPGSYLFVNELGLRFMAEDTKMSHRKGSLEILQFDHRNAQYANLPAFLVFDHTMFKRGPLVPTYDNMVRHRGGPIGHPIVNRVYDWSNDNQAELDKGWIVRSQSVDELATMIGIAPSALAEAVCSYNRACEKGRDLQFGRSPQSMLSIDTPPFYAVELGMSLVNTQGGPKRNGISQVLDHEERPIPRLYAAGELGSFFGFLYQGGSNYPEAWAFGRIAGLAAAAEIRCAH